MCPIRRIGGKYDGQMVKNIYLTIYKLSNHTPKDLYEVTTSCSKPSRGSNNTLGGGAFFLPNHITFVLEVFRTRLRVEKACWTLRKLYCRAFNTTFGEGQDYKTIISI
jgi:hypothetical protein